MILSAWRPDRRWRRAQACVSGAAFVILTIAASGATPAADGTARDVNRLSGLRRGVVYLRALSRCRLTITVEPVRLLQYPLVLLGPDGRDIIRRRLPGHAGPQTFSLWLEPNRGAYTLPIHAAHRVSVVADRGCGMVFGPEAAVVSMDLTDTATRRLWFRVPPNTAELRLYTTNQKDRSGRTVDIRLADPHGVERWGRRLDPVDDRRISQRLGMREADIAGRRDSFGKIVLPGDGLKLAALEVQVDSAAMHQPVPGMWSVSAAACSSWAQFGLWVAPGPTLLAPSPGCWFTPEFDTGQATVRVVSSVVATRAPAVGAFSAWNASAALHHEQKQYLRMGFTAASILVDHLRIEPVNDDHDPLHTCLDRFNFSGFDQRSRRWLEECEVRRAHVVVHNPPLWLRELARHDRARAAAEIAEFFITVVRHFLAATGLSSDSVYFQYGNEPNLDANVEMYVSDLAEVARRLRANPDPKVRTARLAAPGIGSPWNSSSLVDWQWITTVLQRLDPWIDAVCWNQYNIEELTDTRLFGAALDTTRALIRRHDRDGILEPVIIGATNLRGGPYLEPARQDGIYAAIWWASVLSQTLVRSDVAMVNYFCLRDYRPYNKGLLFENGAPKPVADATWLCLSRTRACALQCLSDHEGVDAMAWRSRQGDTVSIVLVNRTHNPLRVTCSVAGITRAPATLSGAALDSAGLLTTGNNGIAWNHRHDQLSISCLLQPMSIRALDIIMLPQKMLRRKRPYHDFKPVPDTIVTSGI